MYIVTGFRPLLCLSSSSHHDYNTTSSTLLVASLVVNPTFARTINFRKYRRCASRGRLFKEHAHWKKDMEGVSADGREMPCPQGRTEDRRMGTEGDG